MKPSHNTHAHYPDAPGEAELRAHWQTQRPKLGPSAETLEQVKRRIRAEAARHAQQPARGLLAILQDSWQPLVAVAASLLVLLGGVHLRNRQIARAQMWHDLDQVENAIHQELDALEATVWDALAELEADAPTNELLLQALTQQIMIWEDR